VDAGRGSVTLVLIAALVFGFLAVEAVRAAGNEARQRAAGGVEPPGDVYQAMRIAYPAAFAAMIAEGVWRGVPPTLVFADGTAVFTAAKALKWWAILTLGRCWTFRVLVVPGTPRIASGPYRLLRHPNYVGVIGELAGVGLMTGAALTAPIAIAAFGCLIVMRIKVEEAALANGGASRV
jgi:methyltransferase